MVCIAAFIILAIISIPVLGLSIIGHWNKKVAKFISPYFSMFKKAWYCVGKRVTFRPCDSNFKDEIKNSVLSRLVVRHKKWVKPVGAGIEIGAVLIVLITIWSLATALQSGLNLYTYGTCNVENAEGCSFTEGVCGANTKEINPIVGWATNWADLAQDFPKKLLNGWETAKFVPENANYFAEYDDQKPVAIDIFDPGCRFCRESLSNEILDGFTDKYNVTILPYPIKDESGPDGEHKFINSYLIARYIEASRTFANEKVRAPEWVIVKKLFLEKTDGYWNQNWFNGLDGPNGYDSEQAEKVLQTWLNEAGFDAETVAKIAEKANSDETVNILEANYNKIKDGIHIRSIPTILYDNKRHDGLYKIGE